MSGFLYLLSDNIIFPLFECLLMLIFLFGLLQDHLNRHSGRVVTRGEKSQRIIIGVASAIIAVVSNQIVANTDVWKNYRVILMLLNLFITSYLCFFNGWFRNKIMGWWIKFEKKQENL